MEQMKISINITKHYLLYIKIIHFFVKQAFTVSLKRIDFFWIQNVILQLSYDVTKVQKNQKRETERIYYASNSKSSHKTISFTVLTPHPNFLYLKLKTEEQLDTQEREYSVDLDSRSENDHNSSKRSKFQDNFFDTQQLSYSADPRDLSESDKVKAIKVYPTFAS